MTPFEHLRRYQTRRAFLGYTTTGLGAMALGSLLHQDLFATQPGAAPAPDGLLGLLWAGRRVRRPPRLRGHDEYRRLRPGPANRPAAVAQRLLARPVPGRGAALGWRASAVRQPPSRGQQPAAT